jgi:hypothetical protein
MATVYYGFLSWSAGWFNPGQVHSWYWNNPVYAAAYSVTAQPVTGDPNAAHRTLRVDNVRVDGTPSGRTLQFDVKNVGTDAVPGYGIGIGAITS